ncbi:hypothetical protein BDW62DRAFT_201602 [Aspergillus aurantiobrunneus]
MARMFSQHALTTTGPIVRLKRTLTISGATENFMPTMEESTSMSMCTSQTESIKHSRCIPTWKLQDLMSTRRASATVTAETQVRNEYETSKTFNFQVEIDKWEGKRVKSIDGGRYALEGNETKVIRASANLESLEFRSWGYGYLYTVRTSLVSDGRPIDTVTTPTGFRKTEFDNGMFKLNDRTLHLKGYAQRTTNEWPALGSAVPPWLSGFSNELVISSNGNVIRWMHVTPWKQDVESLDHLGILQALPAGDSEADVTGRRWEQRVELMRDAIIYTRNNPSVVFYESGNFEVSEDHMMQMKELRDTFDPHGGRAAGSREVLDSEVAEYGGEMLYINKGSRIPLWQMEYSRDEGSRKYWDNYSVPYHLDGGGTLYNGEVASSYKRNQDSHAIENIERWFDYYEQRPGTGTRVNAGGVNIIFSNSNTHYRGAENYRRSGEVDALRLPKDGWHAHRVTWDNWVDIEKAAGHIIGHWNYNNTTVKDVYVVSTADRVELSLNGKTLGWGEQSSRFLFTFSNVTWEAGELKAFGYSDSGKVLLDQKKTSGTPIAIRLTPQTAPGGFVANGADIALVDVEVVDENASITLSTKPIPVKSGLSTFIPGSDLQPNLLHGPTPSGESYEVSHRSAEILNMTAGSDQGNSTASLDDNEETAWRSDSNKDTAWIEHSWDNPVNFLNWL